LAIKNNI